MSQPKTQILITDIPKEKFDCNWPQQLEDLIFKEQFPQVKPHLEYYTPLAFLNRVVIIFDQEPATLQVYEFLKTKLVGEPVKLFVTESLLGKPRSKSSDQIPTPTSPKDKPVLSIDTAASVTNNSSASLGSPSLSPDKSTLQSPTRLRFPHDSKVHYYQEPLPKHLGSADNGQHVDHTTKFLYRPRNLNINTTNMSSTKKIGAESPPMSPSITLNEFTQ